MTNRKEQILNDNGIELSNGSDTAPIKLTIIKSMDQYAKEVAIEFCMHIVGQLKFNPEGKHFYNEDSNESFLIMLPSNIRTRFDKFMKEKQK